uniref:DNA mismatch repair protein Mlh1 isoform X2 n=1 Tax=Ciona intestinalis TaxID=7719 RepID=UPI000EF47328|nr:DNA mismatch repair protein Mlh1 isoform X2 [Ciona intestinalis]|eukprot:XP_026695234.1 DNA mismatch repair protein Mlh1 isoform X2 [Ciona intestinalis]
MAESGVVVIKRLDETVVNRIAAGEVIQRPANAVKEMIENCLDAGSTTITVSLKSGGLKMLQISDNGHGIRREDMEIVCERFTTSKLKEFDDLKTIATFGFRGEALASISHVAHLSITSRTKDSKCGYKASYLDGRIKGSPRPTAGNTGTQITVEDLFYNVPTRRKAFKSPSEEHQKIADVMTRYALHNSGKSFTLRKTDGDSGPSGGVSVRTQLGSSFVTNIGTLFGSKVAKEVIEVKHYDTQLQLKTFGYISNANCSMKKFVFLLFINNRLVDCSVLKKSLDSVYQSYLPKGSHPFVYLSLEMPTNNLDVNVHPTKHEVHFLHEDEVVTSVQKQVEASLLSCDSSRTFYMQKLLPTNTSKPTGENTKESTKDTTHPTKDKQLPTRVYDHQLVRTDSKLQKLDSFLLKSKNKVVEEPKIPSTPDDIESHDKTSAGLPRKREIRLTSVLQLQDEVKQKSNKDLCLVLHDHTFVGCVEPELALIQHQTKLHLVNTGRLSEQLFYQILLQDFGNFAIFRLTAAPIYELAMLGLNSEESGWTPADGSKEKLAKYVVNFLVEKAEMLSDYFCLDITKDGMISGIPMLLKQYNPPLHGLPTFVMRLATEVDWESEKSCFDTVCKEIARFYAVKNNFTDSDIFSEEPVVVETDSEWSPWKQMVEHVVFRALRDVIVPMTMGEDGTFLQLANLPDLYKVFERC